MLNNQSCKSVDGDIACQCAFQRVAGWCEAMCADKAESPLSCRPKGPSPIKPCRNPPVNGEPIDRWGRAAAYAAIRVVPRRRYIRPSSLDRDEGLFYVLVIFLEVNGMNQAIIGRLADALGHKINHKNKLEMHDNEIYLRKLYRCPGG